MAVKNLFLFFGISAIALFALSFDFLPPAKIAVAVISGDGEPPPTVTITVNPSSIKPGQSATLTWSSNADVVLSSNFGATDTNGTKTVSPSQTTTYKITVKNSDTGLAASAQVTLEVADYQPKVITGPPSYTIGPGPNRTTIICPAGTIASGMVSDGYDNKGTIKVNQIICSTLTNEALSLGISRQGGTYNIDSDQNGASFKCSGSDVLVGGDWAKNNQLDFGYCQSLSAVKLEGSYLSYCPSGAVVNGGKNAPEKHDSWNGYYCAKTLVNTYVPPPPPTASFSISPSSVTAGGSITYSWSSSGGTSYGWGLQIYRGGSSVSSDACGNTSSPTWNGLPLTASGNLSGATAICQGGYSYTITYKVTNGAGTTQATASVTVNPVTGTIRVNSVDSVTGAPVSGSWYFPAGPSDPCGGNVSNCSGASKTYSGVPIGTYTISAPFAGASQPAGYVLQSITPAPSWTLDPTSPACPAGGQAPCIQFNILWRPVVLNLSASFKDTNNVGVQTTISATTTPGGTVNPTFYMRNTGPVGSWLRVGCPPTVSVAGVNVIITCQPDILSGGANPF